jgi:hypothetical protein
VKKSMRSFELSAPTPPKHKMGAAPSQPPNELSMWKEHKDEDSGHSYFTHELTGESMWADEFASFKATLDVAAATPGKPAAPPSGGAPSLAKAESTVGAAAAEAGRISGCRGVTPRAYNPSHLAPILAL